MSGGTLDIVTPRAGDSFSTCINQVITWQGGQSPYTLHIDISNPQGQLSVQTSQVQSTQFTWTPNAAAESSVTLSLSDATGHTASSGPIPIYESGQNGCIGSSSPMTGLTMSSSITPSTTHITVTTTSTLFHSLPSSTSITLPTSHSASLQPRKAFRLVVSLLETLQHQQRYAIVLRCPHNVEEARFHNKPPSRR